MSATSGRGHARVSTPPLSKHQQEMLLPIVRSLCAASRSDAEIAAHLAEHGPFPATRLQVQRIRYKAGIIWTTKWDNSPAAEVRGKALAMVPGVREQFVERVRELAAEARSDSQIAAELGHGITRHQVYFLRRQYRIMPGRHGPVLAQKRRAAADGEPEPTVLAKPTAPLRPTDARNQVRALVEGWIPDRLTDQQMADRLIELGIPTLSDKPGGWTGRRVEAFRRREGLRTLNGRNKIGKRFVPPDGHETHCNTCDGPIETDFLGNAIVHNRLTNMIVGGIRQVGRCEGSREAVICRPIPASGWAKAA